MANFIQKINEQHKKAKLIVFDLDGTLAPSKEDMDQEMALFFRQLLEHKQVAVIGGGKYELFQQHLLAKLGAAEDLFKNLFLFPTTATSFYRYGSDGWQPVYSEELLTDEKKMIFEAFEKTFAELNYHPDDVYRSVVEDRGSEITFSALGQDAPLDLKAEWKEEYGDIKLKMVKILEGYLPDFEVRAAGYTSIDVTRKGIDKEYGIKQINKYLGVSFDQMIFIGDALFPGGNDSAVLRTAVPCIEVSGPEDTKRIIKYLLA